MTIVYAIPYDMLQAEQIEFPKNMQVKEALGGSAASRNDAVTSVGLVPRAVKGAFTDVRLHVTKTDFFFWVA